MEAVKTHESAAERRKRARKILAGLRKTYGEATCALHHETALQLLVATILSAQSTDETVNRVTPGLFRKYPTARALAEAERAELEEEIHSTGFFRQKAKSIQGACRLILDRFGGEVPNRMGDLIELPGVARKTANVVLGTWFKQNDGIVVDTHVGRLAERMALTWTSKTAKDAVKIESDLVELIPKGDWTYFSHVMIRHGREVCTARKPECAACAVAKDCPSAGGLASDAESPPRHKPARGGRRSRT